jgi:hypothetical protein
MEKYRPLYKTVFINVPFIKTVHVFVYKTNLIMKTVIPILQYLNKHNLNEADNLSLCTY